MDVRDFVAMSCVVVGSKEIEMYVYRCDIQKGDPQALEHEQLMWAAESALLSVSWAPADVPLIPQLVQCTKGELIECCFAWRNIGSDCLGYNGNGLM